MPPPCCVWNTENTQKLIKEKFKKEPCSWQVNIAQAIYAGKDVIGIAATGSGKTLSFWIPVVMAMEDGRRMITIVVTPLNILGKQNVDELEKAGISAVSVDSDHCGEDIFKVSLLGHITTTYLKLDIGH